MISVFFQTTPCGRLFFSSQGHARAEPDEVRRICAAASMLSQTLAAALEQEGQALWLHKESGCLALLARGGQEAKACFRTIEAGYALLEGACPENVQINAAYA